MRSTKARHRRPSTPGPYRIVRYEGDWQVAQQRDWDRTFQLPDAKRAAKQVKRKAEYVVVSHVDDELGDDPKTMQVLTKDGKWLSGKAAIRYADAQAEEEL